MVTENCRETVGQDCIFITTDRRTMKHLALPLILLLASAVSAETFLPTDWNPKQAGDKVLADLIQATAPQVKGAHDAEMAITRGRAYVVAEVNDDRAGEGAGWPDIYSAMSIVDLDTMTLKKVIPIARGEQVFENETLPVGACFVPRIVKLNDKTLRCFFASEQPGKRQAQTWYRDFDIPSMTFASTIHRVKLKTSAGTFDMQPKYFYADAVAQGFKKPAKDYGLYLFDSFKNFGGKTYIAINNWPGKQLALAVPNASYDTFEIIGHFNEPQSFNTSEAAVNRLPDGTWMAICRQDGGTELHLHDQPGREDLDASRASRFRSQRFEFETDLRSFWWCLLSRLAGSDANQRRIAFRVQYRCVSRQQDVAAEVPFRDGKVFPVPDVP